eukprot:CAMPEP_0184968246 /NCGR_PEP_ID=MMETSP1098-20130426/1343_1 /TAXON_ID=89044 /ORGANISM="Spumella elongata, Strain CCAP 955/1" /LENGTH=851 /DNA_ID=CAMNT_0027489821 /DNA_START=59 /DNA_END=2614 /DNA_ORIENTATION=+
MSDLENQIRQSKHQVVGTVVEDEVANPIFQHIDLPERTSSKSHQQISTIDDAENVEDDEESLGCSSESESDEELIVTGGRDRAPSAAIAMRRPEPKPSSLGNNIVVLLFVVGIIIGVLNGCVQWLVRVMSQTQALILMSSTPGPFYILLTSAFLVGLSAYIIKVGNEPGTTGSGMAEVKALMVSDFHPSEFCKLVSMKILFLRISSLVTAAGSGLSIGLAAPLTHSAVCFSFWLCKFVPDFGDILENPNLLKQIFAAAAAVGFGSTANTPVGGLLFSVEVTSAFYLISNYWRSFMACTAGAVAFEFIVLAAGRDQSHFISVAQVVNPYQKFEFLFYMLLGLICGVLGLYYLKLQQAWAMLIKPHTLKYPVASAACAGVFTALMIYATGAYSSDGVGPSVIIKDCFNGGYLSELGKYNNIQPVGALFMNTIVRVMLSVLGTTLRISAGLLMCMMCIGSLVGRMFGLIIQSMFDGDQIYVGGYAMVGAVAFASATTHTISAAVIVVEMTGEINMLLPCLIAAVVACGVTKSRSVSLYDQGMMNKGLESFELLLRDTSGFKIAAEVLDKKIISIANECTLGEIFAIMEHMKQATFPVIDSPANMRLLGSIQRDDVFIFLHKTFARHNLVHYLSATLPVDYKYFEQHNKRMQKLAARNNLIRRAQGQSSGDLESMGHSHTTSSSNGNPTGLSVGNEYHINKGLFPTPYQLRYDQVDEEGNPVRKKRTNFQRIYSSLRKAAKNNQIEKAFGIDLGSRGMESPSQDEYDDVPKKTVEELAHENALIEALLQGKVDISSESELPINFSPFTVAHTTTLDQLYILFEMVKVHCVFIVNQDKRLEGMISKHHLLQSLKAK